MVSIHSTANTVAVQRNFERHSTSIERLQERLATGLKVATVRDEASDYAIAAGVRGDQKARQAVAEAVGNARGSATVALSAARMFQDLWGEMKQKIVEGMNPTNTPAQQEILDRDYQAILTRARTALANATYKGANQLIETDNPFDINPGQVHDFNYLVSVDGRIDTVRGQRFDMYWAQQDQESLADNAAATQALATWETTWPDIVEATNQLGADVKTVDMHFQANSDLSEVTTEALGAMVDADLGRESARLIAEETKRALSAQTLSIANANPKLIGELFRKLGA